MIYAFGPFEVDDERFDLRRDGAPVPVQRRTFDLLLYLVRSRDNVATREDLLRHVWPDAVVSAPALTQAILTVRRALGDDVGDPKIIQTVRARGYRFIADVDVRGGPGEAPAPADRTASLRRRPPFVGRAGAVEHLAMAIDDARRGQGRVVFVLGEQGIGKSRLVDEIEARSSGVRFVRGHGFAGDGAPPLWPWIQIQRRLSTAVEGLDPVEETSDARGRFRFSDQIVRAVLDTARQGPTILVLDDVQWVDAASLELVLLLAPELPRSRLLVILIARGVDGRATDPLGAIARLPGASTIELERLGRADVASMVEALTGRPPTRAILDRVLEKTGGTPSLLMQIAHVLRWEDAPYPGTTAMLGTGAVKEAIAQQVGALSEPVRRALTLAAVIGPTFALGPLAIALAVDRHELLGLLDEAIAERVVARGTGEATYRFTQPLVRDALYRRLPDGERAKLHSRVARSLATFWGEEIEAHAVEIAPHLVEAAPLGEAVVAVEMALAAAAKELERGDRGSAERFAALARQALKHAPPSRELDRLRERVDQAVRGGDTPADRGLDDA